MEEGKTPARAIPTSNPDPDPDQKQRGLGVWRVTRQGIRKRPRALGPVRPTSGAVRAATAVQSLTSCLFVSDGSWYHEVIFISLAVPLAIFR